MLTKCFLISPSHLLVFELASEVCEVASCFHHEAVQEQRMTMATEEILA